MDEIVTVVLSVFFQLLFRLSVMGWVVLFVVIFAIVMIIITIGDIGNDMNKLSDWWHGDNHYDDDSTSYINENDHDMRVGSEEAEEEEEEEEEEEDSLKELIRKRYAELHHERAQLFNKESNDHYTGEKTIYVCDVEHFDNVIKEKYSHDYILDQARKQNITWQRLNQNGEMLTPAMEWIRAASAIKSLIRNGGVFEIVDIGNDSEKVIQKYMCSIEKDFQTLSEKHGHAKRDFMEWARNNNYNWPEDPLYPVESWWAFKKHIMSLLAQGEMIDGVRTEQKYFVTNTDTNANDINTSRILNQIMLLRQNYDICDVMARAEEYGLDWIREDKVGNQLNPSIDWMRCSLEIQLWITQGHEFLMDGKTPKKGVN